MRFSLIVLLLSLLQINSFAQGENTARPKIGLVLSGGGAKGIAHIGILKALEKEGIRPDFITGTSMGSVVGGLYAIGYTADQLEQIVRAFNWDAVLSNNIPLSYISYEEKEYYNRYLIELYIDKGLNLPSGLIEGQMLNEALSHYTWSATQYKSFDEFPIPFRCIATDVSTGKEIVFSDGPLSEAMRASMAIPTIFTAATMDSTLAVDGGILNNFPVEEAIEMGADIIIGVNVWGGFEPAEEISNMVGILLQVSMIPSLERMEKQIELCDIYIRPDLKDNSTGSFNNYEEILELGDITGEAYRNEFRDLAQRIGGPNYEMENLEAVSLEVQPVILKEIKLIGIQSSSKQLVKSKLGYEEGDTLSREDLERGIRRIFGINSYHKVIYNIDNAEGDQVILTIKMYEKPEKILKTGIHYDNIFSAGITANVTLRNTLGRSSRSIIAVDISENPRFRFDQIKYVGASRKYALNLRYDYRSLQLPNYSKGEVQDFETNRNHIAWIGLMSTQSLKEFSFAQFRYEFEGRKYKIGNITPEGVKSIRFNRFHVSGGHIRNTHNDRNYPSEGNNLDLIINLYPFNNYNLNYKEGVDSIYIPIDSTETQIPVSKNELDRLVDEFTPDFFATLFFRYSRFTPLAKNFQLIPIVALGATLSSANENNIFDDFIIGGIQKVDYDDHPFLGLHYRELTAPNMASLGFYLQHIFFKKLYLQYGINGLVYHEHVPLDDLDQFDFQNMIDNKSILGYGANLRYRSFLGPITLSISFNNRDPHPRIFFSFGFSFNYSD